MRRQTVDNEVSALLQLEGVVFLEAAYQLLLGRPLDPEGARHYVSQLKSGQPKREILRDIYWSSEGVSRRHHNGPLAAHFPRRGHNLLRHALRLLGVPFRTHIAARPVQLASHGAPPRRSAITITRSADGPGLRAETSRDFEEAVVFVNGLRHNQLPALRAGSGVEVPSVAMDRTRPVVVQIVARSGAESFASELFVGSVSDPILFVDSVGVEFVEGWAVDVSTGRPLSLRASVGEQVVDDIFRTERRDVQVRCRVTSGLHGFRLRLPPVRGTRTEIVRFHAGEFPGLAWDVEIGVPYSHLHDLAVRIAREGTSRVVSRAALASAMGSAEGIRRASVRKLFVNSEAGSSSPPPPCVVIPVYGGAGSARRCIQSVLRAKNDQALELIVVDDGSPHEGIKELLSWYESVAPEWARLIRRPSNGGFSEAVNTGMVAAGAADVVLLNSDTVVFDHWLDRLIAGARSDVRVGTVTPMSNNAEICSVPTICVASDLPGIDEGERMDKIARTVNAGQRAEIPVAVGFCMYIARGCLDDVGLFDAAEWGRGYGEEVDFCLKASARGWRHLAAADVFVAHEGAQSFGEEKRALVRENGRKMSEKYPFYDALIQTFIVADPLAVARHRVALSLLREKHRGRWVFHITHGLGGGTERFVRDLVSLHRAAGELAFVVRGDGRGGLSFEVDLPDSEACALFGTRYVARFDPSLITPLTHTWSQYDIDVRMHSPLDLPSEVLDWVATHPRLVVSVHDYAWICPRVSLSSSGGEYCGEPDAAGCNDCLRENGAHPASFQLPSPTRIEPYRARLLPILQRAREVTVPGEDVRRRLERQGVHASFALRLPPTPKGSAFSRDVQAVTPRSGRVQVAVVGAIGDIKGVNRLLACAREALAMQADLEFVIVGYTSRDEELASLTNVRLTGAYEEAELESRLRDIRPHSIFLPFEVPETFSYVLSSAFWIGVWPVLTDLGTPAERVRESGFGTLFSLDAPPSRIIEILLRTSAQSRRCGPGFFRGVGTISEYEG